MTLGQLRTFLAVAAAGSVREAAERLVVTQPAVSAALASLQREVGVPLVVKDGRGLRLTPAGHTFARHARQALGILDAAVAAAEGTAHPERGQVRLAAVTTAGERIVPRVLASFRSRYPEAVVALEVGNRQRVWDLLAHQEVDLAIGGRPPMAAPSARWPRARTTWCSWRRRRPAPPAPGDRGGLVPGPQWRVVGRIMSASASGRARRAPRP